MPSEDSEDQTECQCRETKQNNVDMMSNYVQKNDLNAKATFLVAYYTTCNLDTCRFLLGFLDIVS